MADRTAYWKARNTRLKLAKLAAKATGNYPTLAWCQQLTDTALLKAFADRGDVLPTLRYFEDEPLFVHERTDNPPPWTDADRAAHRAKHDDHERAMQREHLFSDGLADYLKSLDDATVIKELKRLDPDAWESTSTRYTTSQELKRALAQLLYAKEMTDGK